MEAVKAASDSGQNDLLKMGSELDEHHGALLRQLNKVWTSVQKYKAGTQSAKAALETVRSANPEARVYKKIGHLFVLDSREDIEEELKKKVENFTQQQESLKNVESQLVAKVKSVEEQLVDIQKQVAEKARAAIASK